MRSGLGRLVVVRQQPPSGRLLMVRRVLEQKQPAAEVAADFDVSERTVREWLARWRVGGSQPPDAACWPKAAADRFGAMRA
jgi:transposase-like protein